MSKVKLNGDECGMIAEALNDQIRNIDRMMEFFQHQENKKQDERMRQTKHKMISIRDKVYQEHCKADIGGEG